jgi:hypothetical protein
MGESPGDDNNFGTYNLFSDPTNGGGGGGGRFQDDQRVTQSRAGGVDSGSVHVSSGNTNFFRENQHARKRAMAQEEREQAEQDRVRAAKRTRMPNNQAPRRRPPRDDEAIESPPGFEELAALEAQQQYTFEQLRQLNLPDIAEQGGDFGGPPPPPAQPVVELTTCPLPEQQERDDRIRRAEEQEGIGGPGYRCEICRVGNRHLRSREGLLSDNIRKVFEVIRNGYRRVDPDMWYEDIARRYNELVWELNERLQNRKIVLERWTAAKVRYCLREHMCEDPLSALWTQYERLETINKFLFKNGVFRNRKVDGEDCGIELHPQNHERYMKQTITSATILAKIEAIVAKREQEQEKALQRGSRSLQQIGGGGGGGGGGQNAYNKAASGRAIQRL